MKVTYRNLFILPVVLIALNAFGDEFTKNYSAKYEVNPGALLYIDNKFGDVKCINWEEKAVSIEVVITTERSSETKAQEFFSKINISLTGSADKVSGITTIGSLRGNNEFSIDYTIKMPRNMKADISNKYGGVFMDDLEGSSNISVKYGHLHAGKLLSENNVIDIDYTDASEITYVNKAEISLGYSELKVKESDFLDIHSRYNEVDLGKIAKLKINSGYDEYNIDKAHVINAESDFSEIDIKDLSESLILVMKYGGLEIEEISAGFKEINVNTSYADIELNFDPGASFDILVNESYSDVNISSSYPVKRTELSYTSSRYESKSGKSPAGKVTVDIKHGELNID
ncbi:MAG: hypothetical protein KKA81_07985 [Bacteroidetes bacterium]|nr:hypothetical protein [Bacteroidota bacterium]